MSFDNHTTRQEASMSLDNHTTRQEASMSLDSQTTIQEAIYIGQVKKHLLHNNHVS